MRISVIIPSFNHGKYLGEAIDSVLQQTYSPLEVIVIDDGSTDNTSDVIKPYLSRIQYHHQPNAGIAAARNAGIQLAQGDYLAFLDADDKWSADKLKFQSQVMREDSTLDMIFGQVQQFHCPNISVHARQKLQCSSDIIPGVLASTMLIKTNRFHQVGYFDSQWSTGEFIDWYIKAQSLGLKEKNLNELLLYRRIHDGHLDTRANRNYHHYLHILRKKLNTHA